MPGLNQLKKFTSDIQNIGDEVKIRAQRGEKPAVVPLPEGISEADDSEDFVLGLPENNQEETSPSEENDQLSFAEGESALESDVPDFDALLGGLDDLTETPDLGDFLDEESQNPPQEQSSAGSEIPLEDLDFDSLLNSSESIPEENITESAVPEETVSSLNENIFDDGQIPEIAELSGDADFLNDISSSELPSMEDVSFDDADLTSVAEEHLNQNETLNDASALSDDDFSFDGQEINLNSDIPEEIALDGEKPEENKETAESEETVPSHTFESKADDIPENDFDTSFLDQIPFPDELALDNDSSAAEKTAADAIKENATPSVDASLDVIDEFSPEDFGAGLEEIENAGDIDFSSAPNLSDEEFPVTGTDNSSGSDDFILDDDFEIAGFTDTDMADIGKKKNVDVADFSRAAVKPKNTLTDEEYDTFKKNLINYPLNLRLAVEDFIAKNEFTDDAVFEVIEKIIKKLPARQIASHLEKLLDISIDVPRDYERRSFAEYEAYRQSFQYQLKNRIIPGGIAAALIAFVGYFLFQAGVFFIYKPSMANMLYKQGYTLLENNEYPQSEEKFIEAVKYKPVKKWFFRYAQGYREHRQYQRASQMYLNIWTNFRHDKQSGLDWAEMELCDRGNFQKAEEVTRRRVLDYHINDKDGLLMLGDIFLEWGETDSSKYEEARKTYADLINLYGATDLYRSRMMRYFIRTDKLKNVLELKNTFFPKEKSLVPEDWVELSGYLLEKLYGDLTRAEEYLRSQIEDLRSMLEISVRLAPENPASHYNYAKYFLENGNFENSKQELKLSIECFEKLQKLSKKDIYRQIDACRLLGERYASTREYIKAQETYTKGITLFQNENQKNGFSGDKNTGMLYADMGNVEYFISGDMDAALKNYEMAVKNKNDVPSVNYKIGVINYKKNEYDKALASFLKAAETEDGDENLLMALGNVLSLKGDNFAAEGYYSHLLGLLDKEKGRRVMLFPHTKNEDNILLEQYVKVNNNLGVTLYRIARQTGDSAKNAQAIVRLSESIRAWDALTRDPDSMVRLGGSNLALQNSKYITASNATYEPAIYSDIEYTLSGEKVLE